MKTLTDILPPSAAKVFSTAPLPTRLSTGRQFSHRSLAASELTLSSHRVHKTACRLIKAPAEFHARAAAKGRIVLDIVNPSRDGMKFTTFSVKDTRQKADLDPTMLPRNIHGDSSFLVKVQRGVDPANAAAFASNCRIYDRDRSFNILYVVNLIGGG